MKVSRLLAAVAAIAAVISIGAVSVAEPGHAQDEAVARSEVRFLAARAAACLRPDLEAVFLVPAFFRVSFLRAVRPAGFFAAFFVLRMLMSGFLPPPESHRPHRPGF